LIVTTEPGGNATRTGSGNATAAGVRFQAQVAADIAAAMLADVTLDRRFGLGQAKARIIRL
jgi:hypothetical protein